MQRILISGYGDIARRFAARLPGGVEVRAISRSLGADLDRAETLRPFSGWADTVLHAAPPPAADDTDSRTANLLAMLETGERPGRIVYFSTSGVYGDCAGARIDETRPVNPKTPRAMRRIDAERRLDEWSRMHDIALVVLRVPGIYAEDRLPLERLRAGTPALRPADDSYTNHIHAEDLAAIALRACAADAPAGTYNASDDSEMKMGEWFDLVADRHGLPRPPRIARSDAPGRISPEMLSFMSESRRLSNTKLKRDLGIRLAYPTVFDGVPRVVACA
ncbi:MAG: NAD-dependent epimerase/dehydratase family protein [Betaproteobacteria bacterium]|nr:NAD-dependent epimerase/dehydratase family protein [Betaproteobacteria bacterium]